MKVFRGNLRCMCCTAYAGITLSLCVFLLGVGRKFIVLEVAVRVRSIKSLRLAYREFPYVFMSSVCAVSRPVILLIFEHHARNTKPEKPCVSKKPVVRLTFCKAVQGTPPFVRSSALRCICVSICGLYFVLWAGVRGGIETAV